MTEKNCIIPFLEEITIFIALLLSVDDIVKKATKYFLACPKIHKQNVSFLCDETTTAEG
jgi:hypothetical protein